MPIRINLLAEQQAAEEARRKDPVKRAIWIGSVLIFATVVWAMMEHMELRARRAEYANLETQFRQADEKGRRVRDTMAEAGELEDRVRALEKYSTNRVLWASALDAFQKASMEAIRFKSIDTNQRYVTNGGNVLFTTNLVIPFATKPPAWQFWASAAQSAPVMQTASNLFKTFTNAPPFSTNTIAYTTKMTVTATNLVNGTVTIKADFTLPSISIEDIDILVAAGDYGNPPGGSIDGFMKQIRTIPYFAEHLDKGDAGLRFVDLPTNPEVDMTDPANPVFKRFSIRLKYEDRVLTNE
jgi:hypothetical protein